MKKLLTVIITIAMMASLFIPQASAANDRKFVQVLQASEGQITIDGVINDSEWDKTNRLSLSTKGTGENNSVKLTKWTENDVDDIQFYYSWSDAGLYMAAEVIDTTPAPIAKQETPTVNIEGDRFQIALNPMGLIGDDWQGLFFTFARIQMEEGDTSGDILPMAHNWLQGMLDGSTDMACVFNSTRDADVDLTGYGATFEGKYVPTENGWNMELLLPMDLIASELRIYELDIAEGSTNSLKQFDPKAGALAWASAMICYVDYKTETTDAGEIKNVLTGTGRTTYEGFGVDDWSVAGYPLALKFNTTGQTPDTVTETLKPTDEGDVGEVTLRPDDTDPIVEDTAVEDTDAAGTKAPTTDNTSDPGEKDDSPIVWIIVAVAAVVVIAAVIVVVLKKKKK